MKLTVKVSLVQFAPLWLQCERNAERMQEWARREVERGAELIVFPELANTGYITPALPWLSFQHEETSTAQEFAAAYVEASEPVPGPTTNLLEEVARKYGVFVIVGLSQLHPVIPGSLYNSAVLIGPSGILGIHHKMHIPLNEKLYFYPGNTCEVYHTPLGNIGLMICADRRFPELARVLALKGAEIVCAVTAIPRLTETIDRGTIKAVAVVRAHENGYYFLACNRTGREGDVIFAGRSLVTGPSGAVLAGTDSEDEEAVSVELDSKAILRYRAVMTPFRDRRPEMYHPLVEPFY